MNDDFYIERCIKLAQLAGGNAAPNPLVGAVLVHENRIIGEGYHRRYGEAHAEVNCIESVAATDISLIPDSTLYVSLEPCSHHGKTPPCTDLIIQHNIKRVRIGCIDPFKKVKGAGVRRLMDAGIDVVSGIRENECTALNKRFFTFHEHARPYIILKWAQSANGMIGSPRERIKISNPYTNRIVHKWRSEEAAIMVGHRTAVIDDPLLTNRYWSGKDPVRIILAGYNVPENLKLFEQPGESIVFNKTTTEDRSATSFIGIDDPDYLRAMLHILHSEDVQSILVEGGAATHQRFFEAALWDECRIITNPELLIEDGVPAARVPGMKLIKEERIMTDLIQYYVNPHNRFIVNNDL